MRAPKETMFGATFARRIVVGLTALWISAWPSLAWPLDASLDVSKYGHTQWRNLDGFGPGTIGPIAQTADGYLWLGTPTGLLRFDGVRSVPWRAPPGSDLPDERVRALFGSRDGTLWIGTLRGLASWKDGALVLHPSLKGKTVNAIEEDAEGTMWVGGSGGGKAVLCAIREGNSECHGADGSLGRAILALYRDASSGALWAAGGDRVWKWRPQPILSFSLPSPIGALRTLTGTSDGGVVVGTRGQIVKIANDEVTTIQLPAWAQGLIFTKALRDRDGGLWIAASDFGLLHFHDDHLDTYTATEGLSGDHVLGLFEDREGNVWVSTSHGLDRFRPMAAALYARGDGIKGRVASILAARDGSLWASTSAMVYRLNDGHVSDIRPARSATLFEDHRGRIWMASQYEFGYMEAGEFVAASGVPPGTIDGIAEDSKGNIWIADRQAGLLRLLPNATIERTPWAELGSRGRVSTLTIDPADDSLWLGLWSGGVMNVLDGNVRTFLQLRETEGSQGVGQIRVDADGAVWIATRSALTRIKHGRVSKLDHESGLPCEGAYWTLVDERVVWIYSPCGLVQIDRTEMDTWSAAADQGTNMKVKARLLDNWDGVGQPSNVSAVGQIESVQLFTPKAARSVDGRIWVVTGDGIVAVDPARIPTNRTPPPVHVEQITSDGTPYEARAGLRLPPLQRNLEITYTGLSFTVPEQVRFRYRLEGRDADWQDAGNRRQAFYTDLPPGQYRFSVMAANNSGLWNSQGDTMEFSIAPAWWQTDLFRALCACAVAIALYALYRLRVSRLSRQFALALEARVNERLRIARELHDTLLQSFQGLLLRLQTALQLWPNGDGRRILEEGIDQAADAITEGRDAIEGLRAAATETSDLGDAIRALGQVLATDPASPSARFGIEVRGRPRELHPIVRDDVFCIVGEAMRNAFRHAEPKRIDVDIRYDDRMLSVRVRDDGKGMDRSVAQRGRDGHFGLRGMRERAKLIGGKLALWSRLDAGTEIELTIPAARAYAVIAEGAPSGIETTLTGKAADTADT